MTCPNCKEVFYEEDFQWLINHGKDPNKCPNCGEDL